MPKKLLISLCLLGCPCRYDGLSKPLEKALIDALARRYALIPVCPEQLGGLPTPRPAAEISEGRVLTAEGKDLTAQYEAGAESCLFLARTLQADLALLKEKSPSCGCGLIYDGTHSGRLIPGRGLTAGRLADAGVKIYSECRCRDLLSEEK